MSGFSGRLFGALRHEENVTSWLQQAGWWVQPFGQALFTLDTREKLRLCVDKNGKSISIRWIPDLLAIRSQSPILVDAKSGNRWRETNNHDIEVAAFEAALKWEVTFGIPVWFIFGDGRGIRASDLEFLKINGMMWEGPYCGIGSGTPFYLFNRDGATMKYCDP